MISTNPALRPARRILPRAKNHPHQVAKWGALDSVDDRALPATEFAKLQLRFGFTVDAAAAAHNTKLARYYTREDSGLLASWAGERVYCNPPFSNLRQFVEKAWAEELAAVVVLLLPANRTEQPFWQELIEPRRDRAGSPLRVEFLPGRLRFLRPGDESVTVSRPPFGCCLCIWDHPTSLHPAPPTSDQRASRASHA